MIPGAPPQAGWLRSEPRGSSAFDLDRLVGRGFGDCRVLAAQPLPHGKRNANFSIELADGRRLVLRIYEHDASLCRKELDLMRLISGTVPVPPVLHAEPAGWDNFPPFLITNYVDGISFHDLKRTGDQEAVAQAAFSAGETLAAIGRFTFERAGWLGPGPAVTSPLLQGADPLPRFVDLCLASPNLQARLPAPVRERVHETLWASAQRLAEVDCPASLVHGDFGNRNLLVRQAAGRWSVVAVLDWEFAVAGSPLADLGHFLRYERGAHGGAGVSQVEPHLSQGYLQAGGALPKDWRQMACLLDLAALCGSLTHDLPADMADELVQLVRASLEKQRMKNDE